MLMTAAPHCMLWNQPPLLWTSLVVSRSMETCIGVEKELPAQSTCGQRLHWRGRQCYQGAPKSG